MVWRSAGSEVPDMVWISARRVSAVVYGTVVLWVGDRVLVDVDGEDDEGESDEKLFKCLERRHSLAALRVAPRLSISL